MTPRTHFILAGFLSGIVPVLLPASANAASVKQQAPCAYTSGHCQFFYYNTAVPVIRSYAFNMPRAGRALVQFDGTMQCFLGSPALDKNVVDLASQIVTSAAATADYKLPGGNQYAMRLFYNPADAGPSTTFNLAASRLVSYSSGGKKSVFYKIAKLRMDPGAGCFVNSAAFTVTIFP